MDKERFWELIKESHQASKGDPRKQAKYVTKELARLGESEILAYQAILDDLIDDAYIAELWDIAGIMAGGWGCSEDGFTDFRAWLIGQGKNVFEKALVDPESLVEIVAVGQETQSEALLYVAVNAYELSTGKDADSMPKRAKSIPELGGVILKDEDLLFAEYPKATEKFWNWWVDRNS